MTQQRTQHAAPEPRPSDGGALTEKMVERIQQLRLDGICGLIAQAVERQHGTRTLDRLPMPKPIFTPSPGDESTPLTALQRKEAKLA